MIEASIKIYNADFLFECQKPRNKNGERAVYFVTISNVVCPRIPDDLIYCEAAYQRALESLTKFEIKDAKKDERGIYKFKVKFKSELGFRNKNNPYL